MLDEISNAYKYENIKKNLFFFIILFVFRGVGVSLYKPKMLFSLLINVKIPTDVSILTIMSRKKFMLS